MPTYHVDFHTERGLERVPFTLDDDRPLDAQVRHVLEELRLQGRVLRGGPEDRLVVLWNGRELDAAQPPERLRISPLYPIELTMRRPVPRAVARPEPAASPFLPKGSYIGAVAGFTGGAAAWLVGSTFTDLGDVLVSYGALDLVLAALLGGGVGLVVAGLASSRRNDNAVVASALGLALGAAGAVAGALLGLFLAGLAGLGASRQGFLLARLLVWGMMAAITGLVLALLWVRRDRHRLVDGPLFGLGSGVLGGLVMSLPGPTELWQLIGFGVVGAVLGYALSRPARALGMVELETARGRSPGLLAHREWEVLDEAVNGFGRRFQIRASRGRLSLVSVAGGGEPATVSGQPIGGPVELRNDDRIVVGERTFRFRRFPEATV